MTAPIRYARSGDVNIAYQVTGDGPFDLVLVPGVLLAHRDRLGVPGVRALSRAAGVVRAAHPLRQQGTGLSDRGVGLPDLETRMDDGRAVMDAAGSESAALFGYSEGGPMGVLFATTYERTRALVLYGTYAKRCNPDDEYPWAPTAGSGRATPRASRRRGRGLRPVRDRPERRSGDERLVRAAGTCGPEPGRRTRPHPDELQDGRSGRAPERPLPDSRPPSDGRPRRAGRGGRYMAARIPGARFVELEGDDHIPIVDADQVLDEVEGFLTGTRPAPPSSRVLTTILCTDLVGLDGARADPRGRGLGVAPRSAQRRRPLRAAALLRRGARHRRGRFPRRLRRSLRAIRCARGRRRLRPLGLDVRAGVHTGEVERRPGDKPRDRRPPLRPRPRSPSPERCSSARRPTTSSRARA